MDTVDQEVSDLFSLTRKFSSDILSLTDKESIWWHLANNIIEKFGFEDLVIYEFDSATCLLNQVAAFGGKTDGHDSVVAPIQIPLSKGVVGRCASLKAPILIADTDKCADYITDDAHRMSELAIPILVDGQVFGVIDSEHNQPNFYNETHLKAISVIAEICGTKISQLNTLAKLEKTIEEKEYTAKIQNALIEISEIVYESKTIRDFYRSLHQSIDKITFAKNFYVAYVKDEGGRIDFSYHVDEYDFMPEGMKYSLDTDKPSITEYAIDQGKPIIMYEEEINSLVAAGKIFIRGNMPKAWLGIPFGHGDKKGIVVIQSYSGDYIFSEKDSQLITFVAKHIYNAIERKEASERLNFLALHDSLTKLPNRALFQDKIDSAILRVKTQRTEGLVVFYVDLDLFKEVNDTYGHKIGDKVLIESSRKINDCLRESDVLGRLGGDEFAILLEGNIKTDTTHRIAKSIISAFDEPMAIDDFMVKISVSVGAAIYKNGEENAESLMVKADNAMYQSKLKGRNQYTMHRISSNDNQFPVSRIEYDFLEALKNDELYFVFQPLINFNTNKIQSAEVLVRWEHKLIGLIPPDQFIPVLERSGLIIELDMYVIEQSIITFSRSMDMLPEYFRLNVNVSSIGFASTKFIAHFKALALQYPEIVKHICIEITEESLIGDVDVVKKHIGMLHKLGVWVALDDFGTGYLSLNYLDNFNFDCLKIDKSFLEGIERSKKKKLILAAIINLGKSLNIKVTVEGIETERHFFMLKDMGADFGQGYFISKPADKSALMGKQYDCLALA
jgi:diguanylate cyclase (GGDEF)-like protein